MTSPASILGIPSGSQSERDTLSALPSFTGSALYNNTTTGATDLTLNGGTSWQQVANTSQIPTVNAPSYGRIFFQGNTTITAMTLNQNQTPAGGAYVEGPTTADWGLVGNSLVYSGTTTRDFLVSSTLGVSVFTPGTTPPNAGSFRISINNIVDLTSGMPGTVSLQIGQFNSTSVQTMSTGQAIRCIMVNTQNNDDWVCDTLNLTVIALN